MIPSTAKRDSKNLIPPSSSDHDEMHLWLSDVENKLKIIRSVVANSIPQPEDTKERCRCSSYYSHSDSTNANGQQEECFEVYLTKYVQTLGNDCVTWETEKPIYGYNMFLHGIVDCLIYFTRKYIVETHHWHHKYPDDCKVDKKQEGHQYLILCEIKPTLDSISSTMGQIQVYKDYVIREFRNKLGMDMDAAQKCVKPVIITSDQNTRYDKMLQQQGIHVFRIPPDELDLDLGLDLPLKE